VNTNDVVLAACAAGIRDARLATGYIEGDRPSRAVTNSARARDPGFRFGEALVAAIGPDIVARPHQEQRGRRRGSRGRLCPRAAVSQLGDSGCGLAAASRTKGVACSVAAQECRWPLRRGMRARDQRYGCIS
jgi:hypothetical protein